MAGGTGVRLAVHVGVRVAVLGMAVGMIVPSVEEGNTPSIAMQYIGAVVLNDVFVGGLAETDGKVPTRLGRLNVVAFVLPYFVPMIAYSAWYWDLFRDCPLHASQPTGTKLYGNIVIEPINGSYIRDETRRDEAIRGLPTKNSPCVIMPTRRKKVRRDIVMTVLSLCLRRPESHNCNDVHHPRRADVLQVGQGKCCQSIAPVRSANQLKQGLVVTDAQLSANARHPAIGEIGIRHEQHHTEEGFHTLNPFYGREGNTPDVQMM